jgi:hypothetical protein
MLASRPFEADLVIKTAEGQPIAVVEVKSRKNLSRDVVSEIRNNMLARGLPARIPYFLLLSPDKGYLWVGEKQGDPDLPSVYEFPMDKVIARYSPKEPGQRLFGSELELLVLQWLTHLSLNPQEANEEPERTLERAGFNDAIKDSMVLIGEAL